MRSASGGECEPMTAGHYASDDDRSPSPSPLSLCVGYTLWLAFGFIVGLHWVWLACISPAGWSLAGLRSGAVANAALYWLCLVLFVVFRQTMLPWAVDCPGGETMSTDCLFHTQPTKYAVFYVVHIYLLVLSVVRWAYELGALWKWAEQSESRRRRTLCCCASGVGPNADWAGALLCAVIAGIMTLGWALSNWSVG
eukprot:TRINITY_DN47866_c0_g1_i1.p1 TRINITY_DN47866_c0_g1~~TRINITY_DN47866_c0_g1_i1.p1  ORF type:complete len:213 (+),score=46.83 TRINITY_DN47866_c0_g1_i1:52-639(+)